MALVLKSHEFLILNKIELEQPTISLASDKESLSLSIIIISQANAISPFRNAQIDQCEIRIVPHTVSREANEESNIQRARDSIKRKYLIRILLKIVKRKRRRRCATLKTVV